jgi:hypothetical protein
VELIFWTNNNYSSQETPMSSNGGSMMEITAEEFSLLQNQIVTLRTKEFENEEQQKKKNQGSKENKFNTFRNSKFTEKKQRN